MNWSTHAITNVVPELRDYNLYSSDIVLQEAVQRVGASGHALKLSHYGEKLGSATVMQMAEDANHFKPELHTFDRQGYRVDRVVFHPAWHSLMQMFREQELVSQPFSDVRPGAWGAYAAGFFMHGQIESGSQCPNSMTFACIPVLQKEPDLFAQLAPKLYSTVYDARDIPWEEKTSVLIGMGMTEKQGGSDVRSNTTRAEPLAGSASSKDYLITGHKWFFSAPMCDAHLVVARTEQGFSCFFVPRYRPDGSKNAVQIQRLKEKVGNRSNSSSEVEFLGAWGRMIGEEGRGIPTIIEMATYTRLHCVISSAGNIRQGTVQAINYARQRIAFGKPLVEQPLMRNVLTDMALESEAATLLMMRLTQAFEHAGDPLQNAFKRIVTPAAKFWVAKRSVELGGEAMEVFGGNGYMEEGPMGRLYRETPVISIWEGSGNVMALDMLRAMSREPELLQVLISSLAHEVNDDAVLKVQLNMLQSDLQQPAEILEATARRVAQRLILLIQASLMRQHSPSAIADAFISSRFEPEWGRVFGALPASALGSGAIERAWPSRI